MAPAGTLGKPLFVLPAVTGGGLERPIPAVQAGSAPVLAGIAGGCSLLGTSSALHTLLPLHLQGSPAFLLLPATAAAWHFSSD